MKKTIIIIVVIGMIGLLNYGLRQQQRGPIQLVPSSNTSTGASSSTATSPASSSQPTASPVASSTSYKDGTYTGSSQDNPYGTVQIAVVISGGKITDVHFLQMPYAHSYSQQVSSASEPLLKQTTLQAQNSNIEFVSGATYTSESYQTSLQSALDQAKV